jgi:hypothetical protein
MRTGWSVGSLEWRRRQAAEPAPAASPRPRVASQTGRGLELATEHGRARATGNAARSEASSAQHIKALAARLAERAAASGTTRARHPLDRFCFVVAGTDAVGTALQATAKRAAEILQPYVRRTAGAGVADCLDVPRMLSDVREPRSAKAAGDTFALGILAAMALEGAKIHELPLTLEQKLTAALYSSALDLHRAAIFFNDDGAQFHGNWWQLSHVRDGVRASDALNSMLQHPDAYSYECNVGIHVARMFVILRTIGPTAFDAAFPGFAFDMNERLMPKGYQATLPIVHDPDPASAQDVFTVGAWNAFTNRAAVDQINQNWNALNLGKLAGERVFYLASNGPRIRTEREVLAMLRSLPTRDREDPPFLAKHNLLFDVKAVGRLTTAAN